MSMSKEIYLVSQILSSKRYGSIPSLRMDGHHCLLHGPIEKMYHYTLVNFQSQLLCIDGYESPCVNNTYPLNKEIFALDGNGWKNVAPFLILTFHLAMYQLHVKSYHVGPEKRHESQDFVLQR